MFGDLMPGPGTALTPADCVKAGGFWDEGGDVIHGGQLPHCVPNLKTGPCTAPFACIGGVPIRKVIVGVLGVGLVGTVLYFAFRTKKERRR